MEKLDGAFTDGNVRAVPLCIFDSSLVPFAFRGVTQFGSVCPPLEEDQLGGFKSPPAPDISDDVLGDTVWLTDMANAEEILQPRKYV